MTARWPGLMKLATAAAYVDVSERAFQREVAQGRMPPSVMFGGREHWHKEALDRALAIIAGEGSDAAEAEFWSRGKAA